MIYCILGQTASGKTSLALSLARTYHVPVISADAFQCFKMMQIGTDKPKKEEIEGLDFYFTDEYEPDHEMSVYLFQQEIRPILERYLSQDKDVLVVGGNFLYVKALLYPYDLSKEEDKEETEKRRAHYESLPLIELQRQLRERSLTTYESIDHNNPRRMIRSLMLLDQGIEREDIVKKNDGQPLYPTEFLALEIDKEEGNRKIDTRIDKMFEEGFVDEVKRLLSIYPSSLRPFHCIGYDEIVTALEEGRAIDDSVKDLIKVHTHQYAKKQRTFLRHQFPNIQKGSKAEIYEYLAKRLEEHL